MYLGLVLILGKIITGFLTASAVIFPSRNLFFYSDIVF